MDKNTIRGTGVESLMTLFISSIKYVMRMLNFADDLFRTSEKLQATNTHETDSSILMISNLPTLKVPHDHTATTHKRLTALN